MSQLYPLPIHAILFIAPIGRRDADSRIYPGAIESTAMLSQEPQPGLTELIDYLERRNVRMALCTRNFE